MFAGISQRTYRENVRRGERIEWRCNQCVLMPVGTFQNLDDSATLPESHSPNESTASSKLYSLAAWMDMEPFPAGEQQRQENDQHQEQIGNQPDMEEEVEDVPPPDASDTEGLCVVCKISKRADMLALIPCGHARFCRQCLNTLFAYSTVPVCPMCRTIIADVLNIYYKPGQNEERFIPRRRSMSPTF